MVLNIRTEVFIFLPRSFLLVQGCPRMLLCDNYSQTLANDHCYKTANNQPDFINRLMNPSTVINDPQEADKVHSEMVEFVSVIAGEQD